jgi:hypothetical protein
MTRRRNAIAMTASVTGIAAALAGGYAAAGTAGLIDVAALATLGVLIVARGAVRGPEPRPVPEKGQRRDAGRRPTLRAADFPAYATIASDLEWARMSRRHYELALRPRLARLAVALGQPHAADLAGPKRDADGPGPDLATLERIVAALETLPGTTLPGTTLPGTTLPGTTLPGATLPGTGERR